MGEEEGCGQQEGGNDRGTNVPASKNVGIQAPRYGRVAAHGGRVLKRDTRRADAEIVDPRSVAHAKSNACAASVWACASTARASSGTLHIRSKPVGRRQQLVISSW